MKNWVSIAGAKVLFQNKNWSIEKISEKEIAITNGYDVCYAYLSKDLDKLVVDRKIYPSYIEKRALILARKNIVSIYN
jgi:hypothetical protein